MRPDEPARPALRPRRDRPSAAGSVAGGAGADSGRPAATTARGRCRAHPGQRTCPADRGTLDRAHHRLRHHADCRDQPGGRRRGGGQAARSAGRRQGLGHGEPDRVGRQRAQALRPGGRPRRDHAAAELHAALPDRGHRRRGHRRSGDPLGQRLEQRRHAAGRRTGQGGDAEALGDQHAGAAQRLAEQAGHAAGPLRRSEPQRPAAVGPHPVQHPSRVARALDHAAVLGAGLHHRRRRRRPAAVLRLPQHLPVLAGPRASAACSRRCRAAASCRAWPSPT